MAAEQRKYELGSETIFFVLEAQTELASAELSLLQAEVNYQLAVAGLDHATGELLEPYHVQIAEPQSLALSQAVCFWRHGYLSHACQRK